MLELEKQLRQYRKLKSIIIFPVKIEQSVDISEYNEEFIAGHHTILKETQAAVKTIVGL